MKQRLSGVVDAIVTERPGAQEVRVRISARPDPPGPVGEQFREALNLITLTGRLAVGQRVLLNTLAVEMGLGTGGLDFVISPLESVEEDVTPAGHIMKLRYTP